MQYPNFKEEKLLWKQGYEFVVGLDEAGRGPLAGPVVAAAVMINPKFKTLNLFEPEPQSRRPKQIQNHNIQITKRVLDFGNWDLFRISDLGFWVSGVRD